MPRTIAENLRELLKERAWSKGELARRLGYKTVATVSHWTTGRRVPTAENLKRLSAIFGCPPSRIDPTGITSVPPERRVKRSLQKSHTPADSVSVTTSDKAGVLMNDGGPLPDPKLFDQLSGAWRMLRETKDREAFLATVREYMSDYLAAPSLAKKARR